MIGRNANVVGRSGSKHDTYNTNDRVGNTGRVKRRVDRVWQGKWTPLARQLMRGINLF